MSFTLFVILPSEDVCTLRGLRSGTSIRAVRKRLELETGLPAQTYRLTCAEGQVLHEEHVLHLDVNVWEGFVVRMWLLDSWQDLHDQIVAGDVQRVVQNGAVHLRKEVVPFDSDEASKVRDIVAERGTVALFIASFLGLQEMCKVLLSIGVNPNGRTLYGRTSLFAAISCDNDHVMEILLAHGADLEVQDVDGVSGVELARRVPAKLCLRKIRQCRQQSKGNDTRLVHGEKGLQPPSAYVFRDNHVTKSISDGVEADSDSTSLMSSRQRPQRVQLFQENHLLSPASSAPTRPTSRVTSRRGKGTCGRSNNSADSPCTPRRLLVNMSSKLSGHSEVFVWNDNVNRVSGPPVSQVKGQAPRSSGSTKVKRENVDAERTDHPSTQVSLGVLLPHRPVVQEFSFSGARSVLTTSSATFRPVGAHAFEHNLGQGRRTMAPTKVPETLLKYFKRSGLEIRTASNGDDNNREKDYAPPQEPPGRPPSRAESSLADDVQPGGAADYGSVMGSQDVLSVASAPELQASGASDAAVGSLHGDSDDDGGRVMSRGGAVRFSGRQRSRLLVSRQKQAESWRTMKRRIKIAEEQKRKDLDQNSPKRQSAKESFESWLERKRKERLHLPNDANSSDDSDRDDDKAEKDGGHSQVFDLWLKEVKQRPLGRPKTAAPDSLRHQQTRPLRNLIQVGGGVGEDDPRPDPSTYMSAYKDWQETRESSNTKDLLSVVDIKDAKRRLEEKRQQLLAMALTYEEWLQHTEERKQLMHAILRADLQQLADIEQHNFRMHRAPRQISFTQWRDKVDRRQAEMHSHAQRMRRPQPESPTVRSSAAVPHEEWVKRKKEEARRGSVAARTKSQEEEKGIATVSRSEKEAAWEDWLQRKHRQEMLQLSQPLHSQRQMAFVVRPKKTPTVTQC